MSREPRLDWRSRGGGGRGPGSLGACAVLPSLHLPGDAIGRAAEWNEWSGAGESAAAAEAFPEEPRVQIQDPVHNTCLLPFSQQQLYSSCSLPSSPQVFGHWVPLPSSLVVLDPYSSTLSQQELALSSANMPAAVVDNSQVICEVWAINLEEEMRKIRELVRSFSYIAMDTEFPGVVVRPIGEFRSTIDYQYQLLRCNVDLLKIIQLGLTFMNEKGEYPPGTNTWQFNFKFNLTEDMYSQDSIDLLANSGLQFQKHEEEGIDTLHFAELLMTSGVVLCDNVKWLSFHSGYDFGYMVKLLTDSRLPEEEHEFFHILNLFFPSIYDVKYLMKSCKNLKGGLQEVADQLDLQRIGRQHQAGSDSLLTGMAFFRMKELFFEDHIDDAKYCGRLYGLGTGVAPKSNEEAEEKMSILSLINNGQP
ncbi:CCR4-NOT transcription complex subunit 8 [Rhinatrema bivittatum]|uniref:CCR4-NOT transcription complex subunit 8 n=1 Tax=Rhinatrema bivittatum TaxID=194408 RepID=UPI00112BB2E3|nr:CCR4-NOT transcription complex subunit 8 [Rhinatrema bivittatum]